MTSFKQKLKSLLNDSSSIKDMSNIDQKFDQFLMRTYKKIKKDNAPKSIIVSKYSNNTPKVTRNYIQINSHQRKNNRGISPNIAKRMAQTFSLMNKENSMNNQNEDFYNVLNKYLDNSTKMQRKIQKSIDYITKDIYTSKSKCSGINRTKSVFNFNAINMNNHSHKNKIIDNMMAILEKNNNNSSIKKEREIKSTGFRKNLRKEKLDFCDYFNQFRNRQKFIHFNF